MSELPEHRQTALREAAEWYLRECRWLEEQYTTIGPNDIATILLAEAIDRAIGAIEGIELL